MSIIQLIERLTELHAKHGNMEVEVRNPAGDYDTAEDVQIVNVSGNSKVVVRRVYIDT